MLSTVALLAAAFPFARAASSLVGVHPQKAALYTPITSTNPPTWKCLNDSSHVIPFSAVNDDYCDCEDGSDEPGKLLTPPLKAPYAQCALCYVQARARVPRALSTASTRATLAPRSPADA